jgi:hypothetical protein
MNITHKAFPIYDAAVALLVIGMLLGTILKLLS